MYTFVGPKCGLGLTCVCGFNECSPGPEFNARSVLPCPPGVMRVVVTISLQDIGTSMVHDMCSLQGILQHKIVFFLHISENVFFFMLKQ